VRVLTAVPGWEAAVAVPAGHPTVQVVRRCPDLEDLLVTAATGVAEAALVSSELPRLDRDALARLRALGLALVGLAPPGDEGAERRLRQLGLEHVLQADAALDDLVGCLLVAVHQVRPEDAHVGFAHALPAPAPPQPVAAEPVRGRGQVVAVWGPTGGPGRTTVASALAAEVARLGWPTLLVDADPYGGAVAHGLGLAEEVPGLAAACREANVGTLDAQRLGALVVPVGPSLEVLTGLDRAERWPELRPAALEAVLGLARARAAVTVVDCGFCLEQDEELSYDTLAPRRNGATLTALEEADLVVAVGAADALGLQRLLIGLAELRDAVPGARTAVVLNRVRGSGVPERELREGLRRHAGVERVTCVPDDVPAVDRALAAGRPLADVVPGSPARQALSALAGSLVGRR
jgi:MinD-like ATPase involved in chromosome partitioning or flagellar assembly